jgi:hypothetical protein
MAALHTVAEKVARADIQADWLEWAAGEGLRYCQAPEPVQKAPARLESRSARKIGRLVAAGVDIEGNS